jgi:hypothetical protein
VVVTTLPRRIISVNTPLYYYTGNDDTIMQNGEYSPHPHAFLGRPPSLHGLRTRARVERESLYRALSPRGNHRLSTLFTVTKAMGLTPTVDTAHISRGR